MSCTINARVFSLTPAVALASICFIALGAAAEAGARRNSDEARPNIVFVLADDLGWTDLGCFGSKYYETPHIDRLRRQGMKFTAAYTCGPNCAPTRACLMSGLYSPRHGIYTVSTGARGKAKFRKMVPVENRTQLPLDIPTVADALQSAGYATGMFGKWHLGNDEQHHPSQRGFQSAVVTRGKHFAPDFNTNPQVDVKDGTYLADFLTERACGFIAENRDRPFFLYVPHFAVHTPIQAKQPAIARFEGKQAVGGHHNPVYAAMIDAVDESVGRIVAKLDELDLTSNTIVIFSSDNGGHGGYGDLGGSTGRNITDNAPLRGGKGMLYEGGIRVPLIVRWPAVVEAGSVCSEPVISVDLFPTLLDVCGRANHHTGLLDGTSLLPLLKSAGHDTLDRQAIYWHFPGYLQADAKLGTWRTTPAGAIRAGDFKLIEFFEDGRIELYDTSADVGERNDLVESMPEQARVLHQQLINWRKAVQAPMPTPKS